MEILQPVAAARVRFAALSEDDKLKQGGTASAYRQKNPIVADIWTTQQPFTVTVFRAESVPEDLCSELIGPDPKRPIAHRSLSAAGCAAFRSSSFNPNSYWRRRENPATVLELGVDAHKRRFMNYLRLDEIHGFIDPTAPPVGLLSRLNTDLFTDTMKKRWASRLYKFEMLEVKENKAPTNRFEEAIQVMSSKRRRRVRPILRDSVEHIHNVPLSRQDKELIDSMF
jgi:hypothetical protein